jgi:predicted lipoprotein with Yx(FWY)xxD motif
MSNLRQLTALLVGATLFVGACTMGAAGTPAATATPGAPAASANPGASAGSGSITVGAATVGTFGAVLTGPDGRTLYTHAGDSMNASTCTGACLAAWPPLTVPAGGQVAAGSGVTGTLAMFNGPDGKQWVTYGGLPLYYWEGDAKPGDATGQGIDGFAVATVAGTAAAPKDGAAAPSTTGGYSY